MRVALVKTIGRGGLLVLWGLLILAPLASVVTQGLLARLPEEALVEVAVPLVGSLGLCAVIGLAAVILGLVPAYVLERTRRHRDWLLLGMLLPLILPRYVTYYAWMLLLSPTGVLGQYVATRPGLSAGLSGIIATSTLILWYWPLAALLMARAWAGLRPELMDLALLEAGGARQRFIYVILPLLAKPLGLAFLICSVLAFSEFTTFHLAGVETVGTQLAVLYELTGSEAAVARAALPSVVIALFTALVALWSFRTVSDTGFTDPSQGRPVTQGARWLCAGLLGLSLLCPVGLLLMNLMDGEEIARFLALHTDELATSFLIAVTSASLAYGIAWRVSDLWHSRPCLGWIIWATLFLALFMPGSILATALLRLMAVCRMPVLLRQSWLVVSLGQVPRFAGIALIILVWLRAGRSAVLQEMAQADGAGTWARWWHVTFPLGWRLFLATFLVLVALSMTELAATMVLLPAGVPHFAMRLLNQMHYARDQQVIASSLVLLGCFTLLMGGGVHVMRCCRRWSHLALAAMVLIPCLTGCLPTDTPEGTPKVVRLFGKTGRGPGEFIYPRAIDRTSDGNLFVIDKTGRIQCLTPEGTCVHGFKMPVIKAGKPTGISVSPHDELFVADTHYHRILVFSFEGQLKHSFGTFGQEAGQFIYPTDVAFAEDGRVYVSEYGGNDRISVFDDQCNYLYSFGEPGHGTGELQRPSALCVDNNRDIVYVADACNHRIVVYDLAGKVLRSFGQVGTEPGEMRYPYDLALMEDGSLVVCEYGNNRIQIFDPDGQSKATYGGPGRGPGELAYPWGVSVDQQRRAAIVDAGNNRIQLWQL